jgi:hypothetical protein
MTIEVETVTVGAKGDALLIKPAFETGERILVFSVATRDNGAQGLEMVVIKTKHIVIPFPGITQDLADLEIRETTLESFETWDGEEMVVAVGGSKGAGEWPKREKSIVKQVESLGLVAKVMFARQSRFLRRVSG